MGHRGVLAVLRRVARVQMNAIPKGTTAANPAGSSHLQIRVLRAASIAHFVR